MEINAKIYAAAINKDTIKAVWTLMEDFIPTLSREKRKFSCKAITGKNIRGWSMLPKYELQTCAYEVSDPDNWQGMLGECGKRFGKNAVIIVSFQSPDSDTYEKHAASAGKIDALFCDTELDVLNPDNYEERLAEFRNQLEESYGKKLGNEIYLWYIKQGGYPSKKSDLGKDYELTINQGILLGCKEIISVNYMGPPRVEIPEEVTKIEDRALQGCKAFSELILPTTLVEIGKESIAYCPYVHSELTIPSRVSTIRSSSLMQTAFTRINVAEDNQYFKSVDGVLFDKKMETLIAYPYGKTDESYTIPEGVKIIGSWAFCGQKYLKKLTLPQSIIKLEDAATPFDGMRVEEITLSSNIENFPVKGFSTFDYLKRVIVTEGVKEPEKFFPGLEIIRI